MGFLDGIGATITQKSNEVASKTRDMVDATSMNGSISKINKTILQQYQVLGEKYYKQHLSDESPEFAEDIKAISASFSEINDLYARIEGIKNNTNNTAQAASGFCTSCGAKVTAGSLFCTSCGAKL